MTIADQLDNLNPFTAKKRAHQAEVSATYDVLQATRKVAADLGPIFSATNRALEVAETEMRELALAAMNDPAADNKYEKAKGIVKAKKDELEKISAAQVAATAAIQQAERDLRTVAHSDRVAEQKRIGNQRLKCATEIVTLVAALHAAHTKLVEVGVKSQMCWPDGYPPQHALLYEQEIFDALAWEFARVSAHGVLPQRGSPPQLPGSAYPWQANHDRSQITPLTDAVTAANDFLLKALDALPLPQTDLPSKEIEPAPVIEPLTPVTVLSKPAPVQSQPVPSPAMFGGVVAVPSRRGNAS